MKRYTIVGVVNKGLTIVADPAGYWVKYEDLAAFGEVDKERDEWRRRLVAVQQIASDLIAVHATPNAEHEVGDDLLDAAANEIERLRSELNKLTDDLHKTERVMDALNHDLSIAMMKGADAEDERDEWKRRAGLMKHWMGVVLTNPNQTDWRKFVRSVPEAAKWFEEDSE